VYFGESSYLFVYGVAISDIKRRTGIGGSRQSSIHIELRGRGNNTNRGSTSAPVRGRHFRGITMGNGLGVISLSLSSVSSNGLLVRRGRPL
jgi:hypothetical protein